MVERKVEYGTDLVPNGEVEWIFGRAMWNGGPEGGIMERGTWLEQTPEGPIGTKNSYPFKGVVPW